MFEEFTNYKSGGEPEGVELPTIDLEGELEGKGSFEALRYLCLKGAKERGIEQKENKKDYYDRVKHELKVLDDLGFTDYILLNWDVLNFCHKNNIIVGEGRGSAAGSLVLYLLGVTNIDPIKYNLYFERFVSKNRAKKIVGKDGKVYLDGSLLADIDNDISYEHRGTVIKYIEDKYKGKTARILTFNTFVAKSCISEATKYFDKAKKEQIDLVSSMIPKVHGKVHSLEKAYEENEDFAKWTEGHKEAYETALKLENLIKNFGVHPSGIAISAQNINDIIPLQLTKDGDLVTGYDMNDVSYLMVKFDILGVRTLSVVQRACGKAGIKREDIDPEDPFIYEQLQTFNEPYGLFQISADTNFDVARKVKPINLEELSDVVALARPASLQFVDEYVKQKENPTKLNLHPDLDELLTPTKNVFLFQETLMKVLNKVFKFDLNDTEMLRRDVGKKRTEQIPLWKEKIYKSGQENNISLEVIDYFWSAVEAACSYAFNKCLSPDSIVYTEKGIKLLDDLKVGDKVLSYDKTDKKNVFCSVVNIYESNADLFEFVFDDNRIIICSMEHKFLTKQGMKKMKDIIKTDLSIIFDEQLEYLKKTEYNNYFISNYGNILSKNKSTKFLKGEIEELKIKKYNFIGNKRSLDLEIDHKDHNFYCNGLITSNSHSISYATLAAKTVYLKYKYPAEFFLSLLEMAEYEQEPLKVVESITFELERFGLKLLPPDLNKSELDFSITEEGIRYGLKSIRGVSEKTFESLIKFRGKSFNNKLELFNAAKKSKINIGVLVALIYSGALGHKDRGRLALEAQAFNILTEREKRNFIKLCNRLGDDILVAIDTAIKEGVLADDGKPIIKPNRFETFRKNFQKYKDLYLHNKNYEKFCAWWFEKHFLGYSHSFDLKECFENEESIVNLTDLGDLNPFDQYKLVGQFNDGFVNTSQKGNRYMRFSFSDSTGSSMFIFADSKLGKSLSNFLDAYGELKKGEIIILSGSLGKDKTPFVNNIKPISTKILTNIRQVHEKI